MKGVAKQNSRVPRASTVSLIFVLLASHLNEFDSEKVMSAGCVGRDK